MDQTANTPPQIFSRKCIAAVKAFRSAKPWCGNIEERKDKFAALHVKLCAAYDLKLELEFAEDIDPLGKSGLSRYHLHDGTVTLHFKLSVVTYFVAIGHARGFPYAQAFNWAIELYRKMFPHSAARHAEHDGVLVRIPGQ